MKKKLLFLVPVLLGMLLSACNSTLIDVFIEHKDTVTCDTIDSYIGDAIVIA